MDFFKIENVEELIDLSKIFTCEIINKKYLLNKNNINSFDFMESFINQISEFHIKKGNYKEDNIYIEFYFQSCEKNIINTIQCDKIEKKVFFEYYYPLLSTITYLTDDFSPLLFTSINIEDYKYKNFNTHNNLFLSLCEKGKHIIFNSKHFFSILNNESEYQSVENNQLSLCINLWEIKPSNIEYYNSKINEKSSDTILSFNENIYNISNISNIEIKKNVLNDTFFENLLYKKNKEFFTDFIIPMGIDSTKYKLFSIKNKEENIIYKKNDLDFIMNDIENINNNIENDLLYNRFLQRFSFPSNYGNELCAWIIKESEIYAKENNGWVSNNNTFFLPINNLKNIFKFVSSTFKNILDKICLHYCLPKNIKINITKLSIEKYDSNYSIYENNNEEDNLKFYLLLNSNFEGGNIFFNDGLNYNFLQGDILVHCTKVKHFISKVSEGEMYLIVGHLNIF